MGLLFFAAPRIPDPPAVNPWPGVEMSWTGTDGSSWSLSDCRSGVRLLAGVRGLGRMRSERHVSTSANVHGSRNRGYRFPEREVFWPLKVAQGDGTQEWLEYDAAFWASMNPRGVGVWRVTQPNGRWRELHVRPVDDDDHQWIDAPGLRGWQHYGAYLVAEDPFWYGAPITSPLWKSAEPVDFIDGEVLGPPYHPGSATTIDTASLTNPGDEVAWPVWTVVGPVDSVEVSVAGHSIGYGSVAQGDTLVIDSDPRVQQAFLNGADVTGSLTSYDFASIRPGETVPLDIVMTGGGTLQASFRPRFDRAW